MQAKVIRILAAVLALSSQLSHAWSGVALDLIKQGIEERAVQIVKGAAQGQAASLPSASGSFTGCRSMFHAGREPAWPQQDSLRPHKLCAEGYAVLYSGLTKTPLVVAERLNREVLAQAANQERPDATRADGRRAEAFFADHRIPSRDRATLDDYAGSGFDRGHMAPAADQASPLAMSQSFVLTNIVPQDPTNNRKVWSKIESDVRKYVKRATGDVFVYTGPLFSGQPHVIGARRVHVPSHLFKVIRDASSGKSWAFIVPNTPDAQVSSPVSYEEFVRISGLNLMP